MIKGACRQQIRQQRQALSRQMVEATSSVICEKVIQSSFFKDAQQIAYYVAHDNEIDPRTIALCAQQFKKSVCLPVLVEQELFFYAVNASTRFAPNQYGIQEPIVSEKDRILPEKIDLFLIPLVAFDKNCCRLGRGGGYYDRCLQFARDKNPKQKPMLMGLAYGFQKVDALPVDTWDVPMDCVVTQEKWYWRG